ncbi:patatin-like phospholipase family protein [Azospirillum sp. TSO22-1]|uniref:patatin-like phospholipase family protein n=1 Tax=Azospirillum sp. TSO22-1 TaxID=716789 RepID=UPI001304D436|nr:patatin-like phospholipase family protein [Azospirillum sp. TSO22-1]
MTAIGLCLQAGGALGAYEVGAATRLLEAGLRPVVLTGVSIGAINAAVLAASRDPDPAAALRELWNDLEVPALPVPPVVRQALTSMTGIPGFYRPHTDPFSLGAWTSWYDLAPLADTLERLIDVERLNQPERVRVALTATNVQTGILERFCNADARLGIEHILASAALPPFFPMVRVDEAMYWDGGLFDHMPLRAMLDSLTPAEREDLPLFVLDRETRGSTIPENLHEVGDRVLEILFQNKSWDDFGGPQGLRQYAGLIDAIDRALPRDSAVRRNPQYDKLMEYRCLKNLRVVACPHQPLSGAVDYSADTVETRIRAGWSAADEHLRRVPPGR